ncbi:hypothetical protein [Celeribacter sp. PS-C1]|uniref:hypothetical protein n=1 Tax=Celeribacter sp. PS-C1 TaxID=2820813 RepID=UPI001CA4A6D1|nr:hypothetical protein [Celeribacter sp. PS-C1]MBW6419709.1 hypothetical protein [Celeribacter sp. PS-C1]
MLYLHIGTPKTASTTIQRFLNTTPLSVRTVAAFGDKTAWKLAVTADSPAARERYQRRKDKPADMRFEAVRDTVLGQAALEVGADKNLRYVASCEHFYADFGTDEAAIRKLHRDLAEIFGEVRVIVYLRDQVSFLKSYYAQWVKGKRASSATFEDFVEDQVADGFWLDYYRPMTIWADAFGADNIRAIPFSRDNFPEGNIIVDFLHQIDEATPAALRAAREIRQRNVSPSYGEIRALQRLNRLGLGGMRPVVRNLIKILPAQDFPTEFDAMIRAKSRETNRAVNRDFCSHYARKLPD